MKPTGFAVCAHTFVRINRDSCAVLAANKNELAARAFERVLVLW